MWRIWEGKELFPVGHEERLWEIRKYLTSLRRVCVCVCVCVVFNSMTLSLILAQKYHLRTEYCIAFPIKIKKLYSLNKSLWIKASAKCINVNVNVKIMQIQWTYLMHISCKYSNICEIILECLKCRFHNHNFTGWDRMRQDEIDVCPLLDFVNRRMHHSVRV